MYAGKSLLIGFFKKLLFYIRSYCYYLVCIKKINPIMIALLRNHGIRYLSDLLFSCFVSNFLLLSCLSYPTHTFKVIKTSMKSMLNNLLHIVFIIWDCHIWRICNSIIILIPKAVTGQSECKGFNKVSHQYHSSVVFVVVPIVIFSVWVCVGVCVWVGGGYVLGN